jgi:hypothetical protein
MWHVPHVGIYQQKFFLQQLHYERRRAVTIQKAHVEDVNRAHSSSLAQDTVANKTAVAGNEPFTLPF